jgi:serine/threonine protein kinase
MSDHFDPYAAPEPEAETRDFAEFLVEAEQFSVDGEDSLLGNRAKGRVIRVIHKQAPAGTLAVKREFTSRPGHSDKDFIAELKILFLFRQHPVVSKFYGFTLVPRAIFTEYLPNRSLISILTDVRAGRPRPEWTALLRSKVVFGVACALMHLHAHSPIYRKPRPSNILFDAAWEPRLVDFGFPLSDPPPLSHCFITDPAYYIPPEMIGPDPNTVFDDDVAKVDIFAFGMILYEILTGLVPYPRKTAFAIQDAIVRGQRPSIPDTRDELIVGICQHCWDADPTARPEFYQVVEALYKSDDPPFAGTDRVEYDAYVERIFRETRQPVEAEALFSSLQPRGSPCNQGTTGN